MRIDRITLFHLADPEGVAQGRSGEHSLASLAMHLPDSYAVRDFVPDMPVARVPPGSVILCRAFGDVSQRVTWTLNQPGVRAWVAAGIPVVFDQSPEIGPSTPREWRAFRDAVLAGGGGSGRFVWLQQNERAPQRCAETLGGDQPFRLASVILHYWLHRTRLEMREVPTRPSPSLRRRRFICLNRRLRVHRAVVVGWLHREGLMKEGLVSAPKLSPGDGKLTWPSHEAFVEAANKQFPGFDAEIKAYDAFVDEGVALDEGASPPDSILWDLHAQAAFSLVNETEMRDRNVQRFSEKILKPLAAWHPAVVAGNMGTLQLLREHGFRTFSPWINESYDEIEAPEQRLRAALAEAKRLITMPEVEFDRLLLDLDPVLEHNHRHFMEGLQAVMDRQHAAFRQVLARLCTVE